MSETSYCSFCGKSQHEAEIIIQAHDRRILICGECIDLCRDQMGAERFRRMEAKGKSVPEQVMERLP